MQVRKKLASIGVSAAFILGFAVPLGVAATVVAPAPEAQAACRATNYYWGYKVHWGRKFYNWYPFGPGCPYFTRGW